MSRMNINQFTNQNLGEISTAGEELYRTKLKKSLERQHNGEFIAIEVQSGDYFLGKTQADALTAAKKKYPERLLHFVKIGFPATVSMSSQVKPPAYGVLF